MSDFLQVIYKIMPPSIQSLFLTGYNINAYRVRMRGDYKKWLGTFKANEGASLDDLKSLQFKRFVDLLHFATEHSPFYRDLYKGIDIDAFRSVRDIIALPIIDKETLRRNFDKIITIPRAKAHISKTGGTTGKSIEAFFMLQNFQERMAMLDNFRGKFGYSLGKRTAWFSGKAILTDRDIVNRRFWKTDYFHNVRYYSTYHIHPKFLESYVSNLMEFSPEFVVGFPSSMCDIANFASIRNISFSPGRVRAIFPTAETLTPEIRRSLEGFFNAKVYNHYGSSEGSPFIFECERGGLHMEMQSGVFEILDSRNQYSNEGRLVVTSFTSYGTPLIRYDIGDEVVLSTRKCNCGNNNPIVEKILGRTHDVIYSPQVGKINVVNVANCLKGVHGIVKFQIIQPSLDSIIVRVIKDPKIFGANDEAVFLSNLGDRVGKTMTIQLIYVNEILNEPNGKFRLVKSMVEGFS